VNIGVCAKIAPDTATPIRVKADGSGIETAGVKFLVSSYDTFAIEEAVSLKDKKKADKVHVFAVGDDEAVNQLRSGALAVGADDLTICQEAAALESDGLGTARVLAAMIQGTPGIELALLGNRGVDYDNSQVPAMVAELLGWPLVSFVSSLEIDGGTFKAARNVGGGVQEVVTGALPVVISCDKGLNTPRLAKLPDIMKAKTKPVVKKTLADLGLSAAAVAPAVVTSSFSPPPARPKGRVLTGDLAGQVKELVRLLRDEAKVL
jgi:electron transfer flavoprotein beta subunit